LGFEIEIEIDIDIDIDIDIELEFATRLERSSLLLAFLARNKSGSGRRNSCPNKKEYY
jgi:hypothetical protein